MSVKSKEEILQAIREKVGDSSDDGTLTLLEDVSDTLDSFTSNEGEDWKAKYEANDAEWRQRYRDRFFDGEVKTPDPDPEPEPDAEKKTLTYEELFKEEK